MQFLRDRLKTIVVTLVVILLVIGAEYIGALRPIERVLALIVEPMQIGLYQAGNALRPLYSTTDETLVSENADLKIQVSELVQKNNELSTELEQYSEYESQLEFARQREYEFVPATITSRIGQGITTQTISINLGAADNIAVGYPVVYKDGTLLGLVHSVDETQAEVALLASSLLTIQAGIQNRSAQGIIQGAFGTGLQMDLILKDQLLEVGDTVVTNGKDKYIPKGLLIGTVQSISDESSELFKSAAVSLTVQYDTSSVVSVIVPN